MSGEQPIASRSARALEYVRREQAEVRDECEAFRAFHERVGELPVDEGSDRASLCGNTFVESRARSTNSNLEDVLAAYGETVMDVPHYDSVYGDSAVESIGEELGADLLSALVDQERLTPITKSGLEHAVAVNRRSRRSYLDLLEREEAQLERVREDLDEVETGVADALDRPLESYATSALIETYDLLSLQLETLETTATERQAALQSRSLHDIAEFDAETLSAYLYDPLDVTHPVLTDVADVSQWITEQRRDVERAICAR